MPVERQTWVPVETWTAGNARLKRVTEVLDQSARYHVQNVSATGTLALTYPQTLVLAATSGGSVTLTLPVARTVVGFRVECKKTTAANTLTVQAAGGETIDGGASIAWTTQYQSYSLVSDGQAWYVV